MRKGIPSYLLLFLLSACGGETAVPKKTFSSELAQLAIPGVSLYDFGSLSLDASADKTFTVQNVGKYPASSLNGDFTYSAYTYKGGVFPGMGGSCEATLEPGMTCTVVITFSPTYVGTFNEHLRISYFNGATTSLTQNPLINGRAVAGDSGSMDATLGGSGKLPFTIDASDTRAQAVLALADNTIFVAGQVGASGNQDFFLSKHNMDGSLNSAFGSAGRVRVDFGAVDDATAAFRQSDGKLLVAGTAEAAGRTQFAWLRTLPTGLLDSSFGSAGKATYPVGTASARLHALAMQSNGRIIAVGGASNGIDGDFAIVRLMPDGSLDGSFGTAGVALVPVGSGEDEAHAVVVLPDQKILVVGYAIGTSNEDFAAVRLETNGTLDASWGSAGKVFIDFGGQDRALAATLQFDGSIVMVGQTTLGTADTAVARILPDGSLDPAFNATGKQIVSLSANDDEAHAVHIQGDGRIVLASRVGLGPMADVAMVRFNFNGSLDTSFGFSGVTLFPVGIDFDNPTALSLHANGKILVAGEKLGLPTMEAFLARLWP